MNNLDSNQTTNHLHVLLIEPLPVRFRPSLPDALGALPYLRVTRQRRATLASRLAVSLPADVAILGLNQGSVKATDTIQLLWSKWSIPTIVMTLTPSSHQLHVHLVSGLHGYLVWPSPLPILEQTIQLVASGYTVYGPGALELLAPTTRELSDEHDRDDFSAQEAAILELIAQGRHNREIAHLMGLSEKSIEAYITRLLKRLGARTRVDLATWWLQRARAV